MTKESITVMAPPDSERAGSMYAGGSNGHTRVNGHSPKGNNASPRLNFMGKVATILSPEIFYVANPASDHSEIQHPSLEEIIAFGLRTKRLPTNGKVTFVGSGGAAKGYWVLGFVNELKKYIKIDKYLVTSVPALLSIGEVAGPEKLETLAKKVHELLKEREHHRYVRIAKRMATLLTAGYFRKPLDSVGKLWNLLEAEEIQREDGTSIRSPKGIVTAEPLEAAIKELTGEKTLADIGNFTIMTMDYIKKGFVALGKEHPDTPLYHAVPAGIALQMIMPYKKYNGSLLGDAGPLYYFPLLKKYIDKDTTTIIGVDLNFNNDNHNGLPPFMADKAQQEHIADIEKTRERVANFTLASVEELLEIGDYSKQMLAYFAPKIDNVPSGAIDIPKPQRERLIEEGKQAARAFVSRLRQPVWNIPYSFQYAT